MLLRYNSKLIVPPSAGGCSPCRTRDSGRRLHTPQLCRSNPPEWRGPRCPGDNILSPETSSCRGRARSPRPRRRRPGPSPASARSTCVSPTDGTLLHTFSTSSIFILSTTQELFLCVKNVITTLQIKAVMVTHQISASGSNIHLSVKNVITNIQTKAAWQHIKSMLVCLTFLCNKCVRQFTGKITH